MTATQTQSVSQLLGAALAAVPPPPAAASSIQLDLPAAKRAFLDTARQLCPGFDVRPEHAPVLDGIVRWAIADPSGPYNPGAGLLLWGEVGTGKTTLAAIAAAFRRRVTGSPYIYRAANAIQICAAYQADGYPGVDPYIAWRSLGIDELGSETIPTTHYGSAENVLQYLLQRRHDTRSAHDGDTRAALPVTYVTTNLEPSQLADLYSPRIYDRCREILNIIPLRGATRRRPAAQ